jgi:hypothetical protein
VSVVCSATCHLGCSYLCQKQICHVGIFLDISFTAVTHGIIPHADDGDGIGCQLGTDCWLHNRRCLQTPIGGMLESEGFMYIATPAAMVHAIAEHTYQTFPFRDNQTTLFHRAVTRFNLQEDKEVIIRGISRV